MNLEPGYYWLHDGEEWKILFYDEIFHKFYQMGKIEAIYLKDIDMKALVRVAFPLCTHNWGPVGRKE